MRDWSSKIIGVGILIILGISLLVQLQSSNEERATLEANVKILQAQVEALGGDPAAGPASNPNDPIIIAGERGERGFTGPQGPQGIPGATGDQGPTGATGATGVGSPGQPGPPGDSGATGSQGPEGSQGPQGQPGIQGPEGPQGLEGYPTSWTYTETDQLGESHTFVCTDPDGDHAYSCEEATA